ICHVGPGRPARGQRQFALRLAARRPPRSASVDVGGPPRGAHLPRSAILLIPIGKEHTVSNLIDHRQLGRELDLFASSPLVGAGLPLWLPAGAAARHAIEEFVREQERRAGYQHVYSPPLGRREMYERSG